ncbi:MAG: T9SS type A sorting domain-containing protein [Flavobacteriales bacterium]|nr:MAG: Beta-mannanase/endoglucanase A precursor [Chlorobi bacterium OLB6]MBE2266557.1 T9SS type A sorting domain-containing protein [Flavobacteriales bacterium]MBV6463630.1 hypothetical protein [Chlorobiota bacterium]MCC6330767.1 T9SS type A sorting domain-containing protein [Ignavibacteria bacterium]MCL4277574.1 T9SS type A sorting domain-containing protein [Ignavibacteria bacterium]
MIRACLFCIAVLSLLLPASAAETTIIVSATDNRTTISPYIFGKNNCGPASPGDPVPEAEVIRMRDAGLRFARENTGNNASKYNWKKNISSHPDWYNNVYAHDWTNNALWLQKNLPGIQTMWAFQLTGFAAKTSSANFNDWQYNGSQWWSGACQNLAGGGIPNDAGGCAAKTEGNPNSYLQLWDADSTTDLLTQWFGTDDNGQLKVANNLYWDMDNEPDIWGDTHDDIFNGQPTPEEFMQRYFDVAHKARTKAPGIKLCGPVPASEWQWYAWDNKIISAGGKEYVWLEYFIKRCAEEEQATGVRVLDVVDIHSYPGEAQAADILQGHRVYFDTAYTYPGANGVKLTDPSGWGNSITNENILGRINGWLDQYFGANHGITIGISEYALETTDANVMANAYASTLGTFANHGVEFFSPWYWKPGMWEVMNLFSNYGKTISVKATSSNDNLISAYASVNIANDSLTIIFVNRRTDNEAPCSVEIKDFVVPDGHYKAYLLHNLPDEESFVSKANNALNETAATVSDNKLTLTIPALSVEAVLLTGQVSSVASNPAKSSPLTVYPTPATGSITVRLPEPPLSSIVLTDTYGRERCVDAFIGGSTATLSLHALAAGMYTIRVTDVKGLIHTASFIKLD